MTAALLRLIRPGQFTGTHMLLIMVSFFGIIIVVNIFMATMATTSWTGRVAKNGYVASIDAAKLDKAEATAAELGWTVAITHADGVLRVRLTDSATDAPVAVAVDAEAKDAWGGRIPLSFDQSGANHIATAALADGAWTVNVHMEQGDVAIDYPVFLTVGAP